MASNTSATRDASHISKFNGPNFTFWKFQIFLVLEQHNAIGVLLGNEKPTPSLPWY
jgi:hypothetical protein